jgi:GH35 family endo-1,4-beta-xylanase
MSRTENPTTEQFLNDFLAQAERERELCARLAERLTNDGVPVPEWVRTR